MTGEADGERPFAGAAAPDVDAALSGVANAPVLRKRVDRDCVEKAYGKMPKPCRVVVSGPSAFNSAVRNLLADLVDDEDDITILAA